MKDLVVIAKLVKPRGLRGEIVADILTDFPERFENLGVVFVVKPNGERSELEIEKFWFQKDRIVIKFVGFDSIEASENLRDCEICVAEDEAVELETDEFYDCNCRIARLKPLTVKNSERLKKFCEPAAQKLLSSKARKKNI